MNAANRVLWIVVGAVLTAAGVLGILANRGRIPAVPTNSVLWGSTAQARWRSLGTWGPVIAIVGGIVVAALGLLLLWLELRRRRPRPLPDLVTAVPGPGRTRVSTSTLDHALASDLRADPTVRRATAHLTGAAAAPVVAVRLVVTADADVAQLRGHVDRALRRFGSTAGMQPQLREVAVKMATAEPEAERAPARVH